MQVHFVTKENKGKLIISASSIRPGKKIVFARGKYSTSDVDEILLLMSKSFAVKNVKLAPGQDDNKINSFLMGTHVGDSLSKTKITKELLAEFDPSALDFWDDLAEVAGIPYRSPYVGMIASRVVGMEISTGMHTIIEKFRNGEYQRKTQPDEPNTPDEKEVQNGVNNQTDDDENQTQEHQPKDEEVQTSEKTTTFSGDTKKRKPGRPKKTEKLAVV